MNRNRHAQECTGLPPYDARRGAIHLQYVFELPILRSLDTEKRPTPVAFAQGREGSSVVGLGKSLAWSPRIGRKSHRCPWSFHATGIFLLSTIYIVYIYLILSVYIHMYMHVCFCQNTNIYIYIIIYVYIATTYREERHVSVLTGNYIFLHIKNHTRICMIRHLDILPGLASQVIWASHPTPRLYERCLFQLKPVFSWGNRLVGQSHPEG